MNPMPAPRLGVAIVSALLLPLALGAGAALPWTAGWIDAQRRAEAHDAGERLDALAAEVGDRLIATARDPAAAGYAIERRDDGSAGFPFVPAGAAAPPPDLDDLPAIWLALGRLAAREQNPAAAAEQFARVLDQTPASTWSPADGLAAARAFAAHGEPNRALAVLDAVSAAHAEHWLDLVSVPAAAAILAARIAAAAGMQHAAERRATDLLGGRVPVDPPTADALADALRAAFVVGDREPDAAAVAAFRRAAAVADRDWRETPPGTLHPLVDGGVVAVGADRLVVLGPHTVTATQAAAIAAAALGPFRSVRPDEPGAIAALAWPPLALATGPAAPSRRYAQLTWALGAAAVLTLVIGQLLAWRLVRRELALSRLKSDFVDLVGHELRTPLAALTVKAEMLAHGDVAVDRIAAWQRDVHRAAGRLGGLVERLLDFARLEKGRFEIERKPQPARALLAAGIRAGRDALHLAGRRLIVDVPRSLPTVAGDAELLARALVNLLDNACRHGAGTITLAARGIDDGVEIRVLDEGPGLADIPPSVLWEPFRRGSGATGPGTGLGLAIVARAVRAHGGRVGATDRGAGRGAEFRIWLPAAELTA